MFDPKFLSALRGFFAVALKEREFNDQKQFQSVASWYQIKTKSRGEQRNKDSILLTMTNEMTEQFLKYVEPYFVDFLISKIMTNNNFLDGSGNDFRTGPIPIEAYVEFINLVDVKATFSVKFWFKIETDTFVNGLYIKSVN